MDPKASSTRDQHAGMFGGAERRLRRLGRWEERHSVKICTLTPFSRTGGGDWTVETVNPDSSKSLATYTAGLWDKTEFKNSSNTVISSNSARKANNDRGYDSFNRLTHTKDSRTGAIGVTETQYVSAISSAVAKTIPPAGTSQATSYTYDHRSRRTQVDAPQSDDADSVELDNRLERKFPPPESR